MQRFVIVFVFCLSLLGCATPPAEAAQAAASKKIVLLAAFGATASSAQAGLDAIGQAYSQRGDSVIWAYTSDIIRRKLAEQGRPVFSVSAAMDEAARRGVADLHIQSLHVGAAEEFHQLERMIVKNLMRRPGRFKTVVLGHPLLESERDLNEVVETVLAEFPKERKKDEAIVLMGHGNDRGPGDLMLYAADKAFQAKDKLVWVAAVEGARAFDETLARVKAAGVRRVWLQPLMIVAGDHAVNDMAGPDPDSWASRIKAAGMEPTPLLKGLGELKGVRDVFLRHTDASADDLANSKKTD